jgi:hypothetical protein
METKSLIKLDENIMECFSSDEMLVVKGGGLKEVVKEIIDIITGGG